MSGARWSGVPGDAGGSSLSRLGELAGSFVTVLSPDAGDLRWAARAETARSLAGRALSPSKFRAEDLATSSSRRHSSERLALTFRWAARADDARSLAGRARSLVGVPAQGLLLPWPDQLAGGRPNAISRLLSAFCNHLRSAPRPGSDRVFARAAAAGHRWLHGSGAKMTADIDRAWKGNGTQVTVILKRHPHLRDLLPELVS